MDATSNQRATEYSESACFELYCTHAGKIGAIERFIASLPPEQRYAYPSRATFYRYETDHRWQERYAKIREGVKQDLEGEVGMTPERVNRLSALVMAGCSKRLHQAYENGDLSVFTPRLLDTVWKMQRVERGLSNTIPYEHQQDESDTISRGSISPERMRYLHDKVRQLSPENLHQLAGLLGVEPPPVMLEKRIA